MDALGRHACRTCNQLPVRALHEATAELRSKSLVRGAHSELALRVRPCFVCLEQLSRQRAFRLDDCCLDLFLANATLRARDPRPCLVVLCQRPNNDVPGSFATQLIALYTATCRSLVLLTVPTAMRWLISDSFVDCITVTIELASQVSILISSAATCCVIGCGSIAILCSCCFHAFIQ